MTIEDVIKNRKINELKFAALEAIVKLVDKLQADVDAIDGDENGGEVVEWVLEKAAT